MDIHRSLHNYIDRIVNEVDGMKVMLVDKDISFLLEHEVFLVDMVDNERREALRHCKCICVLRPTPTSIDTLIQEIKDPSFLKNIFVERLAEADEFEVIKQVSEHYVDCVALSSYAFSLNLTECMGEQLGGWIPRSMSRTVEGLCGALLALKRRPAIRFARSSTMAGALANELRSAICDLHRQQFDFRRMDTQPVLLIYDRRADPSSCLLTQWTFQAMLHDLLGDGIVNSRIKFGDQEMALAIDQDAFYRDNMHSNYGDLGDNIQKMVRQYEQRAREQSRTDPSSIKDMKRFIHEYPEWRRMGEQVAKYVALACALQDIIDNNGLLERSEAEQNMLLQSDPIAALKLLEGTLSGIADDKARLRVMLLYASHFTRRPGFNSHSFQDVVKQFSPHNAALLDFAVSYAAGDHSESTAYGSGGESPPSSRPSVTDDTVYTVHTSPIVGVVDKLLRGRLPITDFPLIQTTNPPASPNDRPTDIIVFVVNGGAFQEECQLQRLVNKQFPQVRLVYGCTAFHNAKSYVNELQRIHQHFMQQST